VGLSHLQAESDVETVVVMDGDGEDDPLDVPRLLSEYDRHDGRSVVFAARRRRLTSLGFSLGYHLYRFVHRVLTGRTVRVGNFSVLPRDALNRLVVMPELWSHYAASVYVSRFPHLAVPADRAARLEGGSRMSYHDWVLHGLSALSVYSEAIGTRVIAATAAPLGLALVATLAALAYWFVGGAAGPLTLLIFTSAVLLQLLVTALAFTFLVLTGRRRGSSLPVRDHVHFVQACRPYPSRESR
jgi:hypothetical protein